MSTLRTMKLSETVQIITGAMSEQSLEGRGKRDKRETEDLGVGSLGKVLVIHI